MSHDIAKDVASLMAIAEKKSQLKPLLDERKSIESSLLELDKLPPQKREDKEKERAKLVKKLRHIDHNIDILDEHSSEEIKTKLAFLLSESAPEAKKAFSKLQTIEDDLKSKKETIKEFKEPLTLLLKELQSAISSHKSRFNLKGWLFGRTPRSMATHHINNASLMAKHLMDLKIANNPLPIFKEIQSTADILWEKRNTRWSRTGFLELFEPLFKKFEMEEKALYDQEKALNKEIKENEKKLISLLKKSES